MVGQLTVTGITWGSARWAQIGYWIDEGHAGRGIIPTAVALACDHCLRTMRPAPDRDRDPTRERRQPAGRGEARLHPDRARPALPAHQRRWRDHVLFALTVEEVPEGVRCPARALAASADGLTTQSPQSHDSQATHRSRCRGRSDSGHTVVPVGLTGVIYAARRRGLGGRICSRMALRRHDQAARKPLDRAVLVGHARAGPPRVARDDASSCTPPRTVDRVLTLPLHPVRRPSRRQPRPRPTRAALKAAAARRRRVLVVLVSLTLLTGDRRRPSVSSRCGPLAVPVALIVAFLLVARRQVRRASEAYWDEVADAQPEAHQRHHPSRGARRRVARRDEDRPAAGAEEDDDEPTITLTAGGSRGGARSASVSCTTADGELAVGPAAGHLADVRRQAGRQAQLPHDRPRRARHVVVRPLRAGDRDGRRAPQPTLRRWPRADADEAVDEPPRAVNG